MDCNINDCIDVADVVWLFSHHRAGNPLFYAVTERPIQVGITERLEFVDAPGHAADLERYRARGYRMVSIRINIVTDQPEDLVEVHSPSRGKVDLGGLTVERCAPAPAV